jgi:hypothetical protein
MRLAGVEQRDPSRDYTATVRMADSGIDMNQGNLLPIFVKATIIEGMKVPGTG